MDLKQNYTTSSEHKKAKRSQVGEKHLFKVLTRQPAIGVDLTKDPLLTKSQKRKVRRVELAAAVWDMVVQKKISIREVSQKIHITYYSVWSLLKQLKRDGGRTLVSRESRSFAGRPTVFGLPYEGLATRIMKYQQGNLSLKDLQAYMTLAVGSHHRVPSLTWICETLAN